ncbi:hypothetical protein NDU88_004779 [Pleurodeles waltl]|uniref:Uncharacterized protein n=1 Tax=Pleurodeles waltl TaxID=8319 RepID=A0AAV7MZE1_PLEWA|nr:hypothetical protein NDU88_004779 [Pleurodeles waltl]
MDENERCVCTVVLPDEAFPVKRVEALEMTAQHLNNSVGDEKQKIEEFGKNLEWCMEKMKNLTNEMDGLKSGSKPEMAELVPEVNFEQLKQEMMDLEVFVEGLMSSLNNSNSSVESLYQEVKVMKFSATIPV